MGEHDAVKHIVVGDFVCARLDHCDKVSGGGDGDIHIALCSLLESGVDDILTVNKADDNACDGAVPGDLGDRDSDGNAEHSGDLGLAVGINGHNGGDNAHVVPHILGEKGTDGSVDNAGGEGRLLARSALTALERAGDLAYRIKLLFVVDRKREEIDTLSGFRSHGSGAEHVGLAVADKAGAARKLSHLADLDHKRSAGDLSFILLESFEKHFFTSL